MNNLMKSTLIVLAVVLFAIPVSAENIVLSPINTPDAIVQQDSIMTESWGRFVRFEQNDVVYTKIDKSEVPEVVVKAAAAKYAGYTIEVAAKGSDNSFRLIIKDQDDTLVVYFNESGVFLKEEALGEED